MKYVVPNGGHGWKVALGAAFINAFTQSLISVYGLLFGNRILSMGYGARAVALVLGITQIFAMLTGLFTSVLSKKFSNRQIVITGILLCSSGLILSTVAHDLNTIILGYGILTAIGLCLIQNFAYMAVKSYFNTKRLDAVSLAVTGTSVGQVLMPQLVNFLIRYYGYKGTTLIIAGTCLHGIAGAMFFDPVENHMIEATREREVLMPKVVDNNNCKKNIAVTVCDEKGPAQEKDNLENETNWEFLTHISKMFDLDVLKDAVFINIIIGTSLTYASHMTFSSFFPLSLKKDAHLDNDQIANCLTILSLFDIVGRLSMGKISRRFKLTNRIIFAIGVLMLNAFRSALAMQKSLPYIFLFCGFCGMSKSATVATSNLVVTDHMSKEKEAAGVGFNMILRAFLTFGMSQLLAILRENFHSYALPMVALNCVFVSVVIAWTVEYLIKRYCNCT